MQSFTTESAAVQRRGRSHSRHAARAEHFPLPVGGAARCLAYVYNSSAVDPWDDRGEQSCASHSHRRLCVANAVANSVTDAVPDTFTHAVTDTVPDTFTHAVTHAVPDTVTDVGTNEVLVVSMAAPLRWLRR